MKDPCLLDFVKFFDSLKVKMMTYEEIGVYLRLLAIQWAEESIPANPEIIAVLLSEGCRRVEPSDVEMWFSSSIGDCFETDSFGRLYNQRMREDRMRWLEKKESNRINGSKGGKRKALNARGKRKKPKELPVASEILPPLVATLEPSQSQAIATLKPPSTISVSVSSSVSGSVSLSKKDKEAASPPMSGVGGGADPEPMREADIAIIYRNFQEATEAWCGMLEKPAPRKIKLSKTSRSAIEGALDMGYDAETCVEAMRNVSKSDFFMGRGPDGTGKMRGPRLTLRDIFKFNSKIDTVEVLRGLTKKKNPFTSGKP